MSYGLAAALVGMLGITSGRLAYYTVGFILGG